MTVSRPTRTDSQTDVGPSCDRAVVTDSGYDSNHIVVRDCNVMSDEVARVRKESRTYA